MEKYAELFDKCAQSELKNRKKHILSSYIPLVDCLSPKQDEQNESEHGTDKNDYVNAKAQQSQKESSKKRKRVSSSESDSAQKASRPPKVAKSTTVTSPEDAPTVPKLAIPKSTDVDPMTSTIGKLIQNSESSSELSITPEPKDAPTGSKEKSPGLIPEFSDSDEDQKEPIKTDIAEAMTVLNSTVSKSPTKPMAKVKPQVRQVPADPPIDQSDKGNSTHLELEKTQDISQYPTEITCPKCETTVKSDQLLDLLKHIRIKHGEDDVIAFRIGNKEVFPFTCEECSYGFVNTSTLESHRVQKYLNKDYTKCKRYQKVVKKYKKRLPGKSEQEVISFETIARSDFQCPLQKCTFKSDKFIDIVGHVEHSHSPKQFIVFMTNGKDSKEYFFEVILRHA